MASLKNYADKTDAELYRLTARGDEDAFAALVGRYESFVYTVAYGVLCSRDDAADAAQDAFLKLWRGAGSFRGECEVKTWIYRVTKSTALDAARSRRTRESLPYDDALVDANAPPSDSPELEVERRADAETVRAAVASLQQPYREVIMMREFEGMTYKEIAEAAEIDIGTVKSRLSRAREELYKKLADKFEKRGTKKPRGTSKG